MEYHILFLHSIQLFPTPTTCRVTNISHQTFLSLIRTDNPAFRRFAAPSLAPWLWPEIRRLFVATKKTLRRN